MATKPTAVKKPTVVKTKKPASALRQEMKDVAQATGLPLSFIAKKVRESQSVARQAVKDLSVQLKTARQALRTGPLGSVKSIALAVFSQQ